MLTVRGMARGGRQCTPSTERRARCAGDLFAELSFSIAIRIPSSHINAGAKTMLNL